MYIEEDMKSHIWSSLFLLATAVSGLSAAVPPPEKLLPADTIALVTIPEYAKAKAAWAQWPMGQLWADSSMKAFRDKFTDKLQSDIIAPLEKEFGIKLGEYSGLAQGQVTIAITGSGWDKSDLKEPEFLMLVDSREKSSELKTNIAALKNKWVDGGKQVRVEKIREAEFTTFIFKSGDLKKMLNKVFPNPNAGNEDLEPPKPEKPEKNVEIALGLSDSLLIVGTSSKDIEKVMARQSGGVTSFLGEQAAFASSYASLFRDSQSYGWVNVKLILEAITKKMTQQGDGQGRQQAGPTPDKILAATGLTGLQTLAFNLRDSNDGCVINFNLNVPESSRRGLFKIFAHEAKDAYPPPFVPSDAVKFSRWRLDLQKAWNTLESTLTEAIPQASSVVKMMMDSAGKDKDPNFDLRKQLIANLGDDIINYQKAPRKQTLADLSSPPSLFLISSPKPDQVASAIKALASFMPQQKVKEREFLGRTVYGLNLPPSQLPGGKMVERILHYTGSGGYVAMSTDVATLEEFMRSGESAPKPLKDTPGLAEAAQKVGGMTTGLFGYENQAETMRATLETLKKESGTLANLFASSGFAGRFGVGDNANKLKEWVDFSLLPPFEKISKYFYINLFSGNVTAEGLSFKLYNPTPPQLRK